MQQQQTLFWLDCDVRQKVDFTWQLAMTSSMLVLEEAPKPFPKPNLHPKKVMVTAWWSAAGLIHSNFLNPSETITSEKYAQQIDEMHWKLQHPPLVLINRTGLILLHDTTRPHATQPTGWSFASPATFTWLPANRLPHRQASWQLFTGKMLPQSAVGRKCFPRVHWIPKHGFSCYRHKQSYFLLAKMC